MAMAEDAVAAGSKLAALPMTVSWTEVMRDAEAGTVSCTWSCCGAACASTAPKSHDDAPLPCAQPALKEGAPPFGGVAWRRRVASGTNPPVAHALTVHCAACPRSLLA